MRRAKNGVADPWFIDEPLVTASQSLWRDVLKKSPGGKRMAKPVKLTVTYPNVAAHRPPRDDET